MKTVQAVIKLPESLYLTLSCFGLTRECQQIKKTPCS